MPNTARCCGAFDGVAHSLLRIMVANLSFQHNIPSINDWDVSKSLPFTVVFPAYFKISQDIESYHHVHLFGQSFLFCHTKRGTDPSPTQKYQITPKSPLFDFVPIPPSINQGDGYMTIFFFFLKLIFFFFSRYQFI